MGHFKERDIERLHLEFIQERMEYSQKILATKSQPTFGHFELNDSLLDIIKSENRKNEVEQTRYSDVG